LLGLECTGCGRASGMSSPEHWVGDWKGTHPLTRTCDHMGTRGCCRGKCVVRQPPSTTIKAASRVVGVWTLVTATEW
jgi:hypothetical protein